MQERIRIIQPTDWSFKPMDDYIKNGGDAFSVSRFGYELFKERGIDVASITPDYSKWYAKVLRKLLKLEGCNLVLQVQLIKNSKKYDLIYYSADRHPYLIALARKFRICKKPVLMVCHFSYDTRTVNSKIKKMALAIERKLVFSSIDQIMFNCETLMNLANQDYKIPQKHLINSGWGADLKYFKRGRYNVHEKIKPFFFAAGGANRDYHTLIEAFREINYTLVLSCPKEVIEKEKPIPNNIIFFDYNKYGLDAYYLLREYYHDCEAVLIPVQSKNHVANGASVFVEAMACGKPIIVSDINTNFLDVEKEGIGLKAKMHSSQSWSKVIQYAANHPEQMKEMGKKAYKIAVSRYNYELFTDNVVKCIRKMVVKN